MGDPTRAQTCARTTRNSATSSTTSTSARLHGHRCFSQEAPPTKRLPAGRCVVPDYSDLWPARRAKNITLTAVATQPGVWPARVGELELGRRPDDEFADRYRAWLNPLDNA